MRHVVECGREEVSVYTRLSLAIEEDQKVRTAHIGSTS